jgi:hypothetical protein
MAGVVGIVTVGAVTGKTRSSVASRLNGSRNGAVFSAGTGHSNTHHEDGQRLHYLSSAPHGELRKFHFADGQDLTEQIDGSDVH